MFRFLIRRLLLAIPVLLGVSIIVYTLMRLAPGDPALSIVGHLAPKEQIDTMRQKLDLDKPLYVLYLRWLGQMVRGDFGVSLVTRETVGNLLAQALPITLQLTGFAALLVVLIAFPMGIISAVKRGALADQASRVLALVGISMPNFWLALLLVMLFAVKWRVLPPGAYVSPSEGIIPWLKSMLLPSVAIAAAPASALSRMVRASMLEVLGKDYVRTARGKGLPSARIIIRHALRNALAAPLTVLGMQIGYLLGGAIVVETIFYFPGMGRLLMDGAHLRDYSIIQGVVMVTAFAFVLSNILVDLLYAVINPQVRRSYGGPGADL